jgi:hypothetical protein
MARRLLPGLPQPAVVRPPASLAKKRGVDAVPRDLLNRLTSLWTTDHIHEPEVTNSARRTKSRCHPVVRSLVLLWRRLGIRSKNDLVSPLRSWPSAAFRSPPLEG